MFGTKEDDNEASGAIFVVRLYRVTVVKPGNEPVTETEIE
jgi:hypothetical protein